MSHLMTGAEANYREAFRLLARTAQDGTLYEDDSLLLISTGVPIEWINIAFVRQPPPDPAAAIQTTLDFYRSVEQPFVLRVREGLDESFVRAAAAAGLSYTDTIPCMALAPLAVPPPEPLDGFTIRRVEDTRDLDAFIQVLAPGFELDADYLGRVLTAKLLDEEQARWYIGYAGNEPVATSALLLTDGVAGVHYVATLDAYRRRGFGEAMTRHALHEGAAEGAVMGSLQASEMGYPIYERIGFRRVAGYQTFFRQAEA